MAERTGSNSVGVPALRHSARMTGADELATCVPRAPSPLGCGVRSPALVGRTSQRASRVRISQICFVTLGLALGGCWFVARVGTQQTFTMENASQAYVFGFASAAMTGCAHHDGQDWARGRDVSSAADGSLDPDIALGFAAFAELTERLGHAAACRHALRVRGIKRATDGNLVTEAR